jgi:hypothetical protein
MNDLHLGGVKSVVPVYYFMHHTRDLELVAVDLLVI